jgi:putative Ca2+/H+ antiporter (TMEM165/GDT1 family)
MEWHVVDWKLMATTFGLLLVAELGDKTQLTVIALSTQNKNPVAVFVGAALALVLVTLVGVVVGQTLSHVLPQQLLHKAAAASFVLIGGLLWFEVL